MQTIILAGGLGSRLSELTEVVPKPLVEVGDKPILFHILNIYASQGHKDFIISCGYKSTLIKRYFANLAQEVNDIRVDLSSNLVSIIEKKTLDWRLLIVDTGLKTNTAGRLSLCRKYIEGDEFMYTYGDGLGNINLSLLLESHHSRPNHLVTITGTRPHGRFGSLNLSNDYCVQSFDEKVEGMNSWINGGFGIAKTSALDFVKDPFASWEADVLPEIASVQKLGAYLHEGFWHPMDTMRDKRSLDRLFEENEMPPWLDVC